MVKPHKRLRKLAKGRHDYERIYHSEAEHRSHGKGSYLSLHHVRQAERMR